MNRFFANLELVKAALLAQIEHCKHNYQASDHLSKTERTLEGRRLQGFSEGIEFAIAAIDDYLNTPEYLKENSLMTPQKSIIVQDTAEEGRY
ncbi:hypothetical protein [Chroococcus sp. FPU101]|uniref:hypothetical protein n=1 Tax=Chroococcus sp. FPU101 TaxID=1974212 RepID=UPI001A8D76DF|nr:hypothetical protein [Chroococcus sp. FPU101]GFE68992.1 hypothetical protein CFPU101_16020 [Chroococcus sp. FPU101]